MHLRLHFMGFAMAAACAIGLSTVPVHATVHEIVAQWCSGQDELAPPGISDDQKHTFAQPLRAARVLVRTVDDASHTVLITFDYNHPAIKVQSSGLVVPIGIDEETGFPLFLDMPEPNPNFPAFRHCPGLGF